MMMTWIGVVGLIGAPCARAQSSFPATPATPPRPDIPTSATVLPLNQPSTFRYSDPQGMGSITLTDLGPDPVTTFDLLQVSIAQNGVTFRGSGIATPIPGAPQPFNNLVSFTVTTPNGTAFFFEGKMGLGVEFQGQGTFHPVGNPTQRANWSLLFLPGPNPSPNPGPGATLSLSVDHGCGGVYVLGAPLIITYSASMNDRLTLMIRRSDGSQSVLFANLPVMGGQTYSIQTFVSSLVGMRTLSLSDSSGAQATCTFTGLNNR
jgi:hypothetical protein